MRSIFIKIVTLVMFLHCASNASGQQVSIYTYGQNPNGTFQNDFIMMKVCVPNSMYTGSSFTPLQCTSDKGTLWDVTPTDTVTYFHGDYDAITKGTNGNPVFNPNTCRSLFGNQWIYDFPLGYTSNLEASGNPLYIHWVEKTKHEYTSNATPPLDCSLKTADLYANDAFGVLATITNNSTQYMTLMGTDLAVTPVTTTNNNTGSLCPGPENGTREFAWTRGNGYASTNGPGTQNFNDATAIDIDPSFTNQMPSYNTILLGKQTLIYDSSANPSNNTSYNSSGGPAVAPSSNLFSCANVPNYVSEPIDQSISYSVYFNFIFGPTGSYHLVNTTFTDNANPWSQSTLNPTLPTILQYGFVNVSNNAPVPYTGYGSLAASVSEHIYSTQLYGYATRWELWNEVDLAPAIVIDAVQTYYGQSCSHPGWPYASTSGQVNSDFNYGEPIVVYLPIDVYSGNSLPGATAYATQEPTVPYLQLTEANNVYYGSTSVIITSAGIFSFAATSSDPVHYNVYFWPPKTTDFSHPNPGTNTYLTTHGGTELFVGGDNNVYLNAGVNWYQWLPSSSGSATPGSWVGYAGAPPAAPAASTTTYSPAWAQLITVGQGVNATTNIWYMAACDDFTNVWRANDALSNIKYINTNASTTTADTAADFEVNLPTYPGTTGIPNPDFAHLLGYPYLSYFGLKTPF